MAKIEHILKKHQWKTSYSKFMAPYDKNRAYFKTTPSENFLRITKGKRSRFVLIYRSFSDVYI